MLGFGFWELVIIALVFFIAVGPKKLPQIMRKFAGFYKEFVRLKEDLKFQVLSADEEKNEKPVALRESVKKTLEAPRKSQEKNS